MFWMWLAGVVHGHEMPRNLSSDLVFTKDHQIMPLSVGKLREVAEALRGEPQLVIEVRVHSDDSVDPKVSLAVTQTRADALRAWFVERGVPAAQISGVGVGAAEPVSENADASGRAKNRRVEFKLVRDVDHGDAHAKDPSAH